MGGGGIMRLILLLFVVSFLSCASMLDDAVRGRNDMGRTACERVKRDCKGQYYEHVDKDGNVSCTCSGEY